MYKDLNASPMIRFPIKVNLDLAAHKVSLIIQAALGGIDACADQRYKQQQRQFALDTSLTLQHANRLVKCIVDCKIEAKDAISVRNALELARSIGAKAWEDSPHQLSQLEGIGPVAVRKLVSAGIKTLEELENTDAQKLDMFLSRNPPFGSTLLQQLKKFPKPRVSLKMTSRPFLGRSDKVEANVRAELGFLNEMTPSHFRNKQLRVHFLCETSNGSLEHFARFNAQSLSEGKVVDFTVELLDSSEIIHCYAACDDLAGTLQYATLDPKTPGELFSRKRVAKVREGKEIQHVSAVHRVSPVFAEHCPQPSLIQDEFDDDLDDSDLLAIAPSHISHSQSQHEFLDIDDLVSDNDKPGPRAKSTLSGHGKQRKPVNISSPNDARAPTQMATSSSVNKPRAATSTQWHPQRLPNGKWKCSHICKDRQKCKHTCCKNGSDHPPRAPPRSTVEEGEYQQSTIYENFKRKQEPSKRARGMSSIQTQIASQPVSAYKDAPCAPEGNHRAAKTYKAYPKASSASCGDDAVTSDQESDILGLSSPIQFDRPTNPSACYDSPVNGQSMFLTNSSSPEKIEHELDDMPLAKRRKLSPAILNSYSDHEGDVAATSHASACHSHPGASHVDKASDTWDFDVAQHDRGHPDVSNEFALHNCSLAEEETFTALPGPARSNQSSPEVSIPLPFTHTDNTLDRASTRTVAVEYMEQKEEEDNKTALDLIKAMFGDVVDIVD